MAERIPPARSKVEGEQLLRQILEGTLGEPEGPRRIHPDEMILRAVLEPSGGGKSEASSPYRPAIELRRMAKACATTTCSGRTWHVKEYTGHGEHKRKLAVPIAVCAVCGLEWRTWIEVVPRISANPPSGWDGGFCGVLYPGEELPPQRVLLRPTRSCSSGRVERPVSARDLQLRKVAEQFHRSRKWRWPARVYFTYALEYAGVRGRGGVRVLASKAAQLWPRARFRWTKTKVHELVTKGRAEWARRLQEAGLIEPGDWWRGEEDHVQHPEGRAANSDGPPTVDQAGRVRLGAHRSRRWADLRPDRGGASTAEGRERAEGA